MAKNMKIRRGNDGFSYPYTSPDIVIDENGKSATTKFNELEAKIEEGSGTSIDDVNTSTDKTWSSSKIDSQFKDIAKQTITTNERNKLNSLENYDDTTVKNDIKNVKQQVNNLVLGAVGDGNNAEVVQARGSYSTLNDRHSASELAIEQIKNLIDIKVNWTDKKCIDRFGIVNDDNLRSISDYIFCYNANKVKFNAENNNEYVNGISFYDKAYTYLQGVSNVKQGEYEVTVPKNAFYLRLSILTSNKKASFVDLGNMYYNIIMQNIDDIKNMQINKKDSNFTVTNYALLCENIYEDYYYNIGKLEKDPIKKRNATNLVVLDREYNLYCSNNGNIDVIFFDKSKTYISAKYCTDGTPILKKDFPQEAYFVAFTYYRDSVIGNSFFVSKLNTNINKLAGSTIKKEKGVRPVINILKADSEEQIFTKLCDAWYTQDCDVYFEYGTYNFNSIFDLMKTKYQWITAYELPIGSNCRYYFNNSTLIATYTGTDENVANNTSLMGSHRDSGSYELHDGNLVANNIVYAVHDEASGLEKEYLRKYVNMNMKYIKGDKSQYLSKCIGGGTGQNGSVIIDNCFFDSNDYKDVSYHGTDNNTGTFNISITNSYFSNGVGLDTLGANENAILKYSNNSHKVNVNNSDRWTVYSWNNETRS